jgi:hypothetical protein
MPHLPFVNHKSTARPVADWPIVDLLPRASCSNPKGRRPAVVAEARGRRVAQGGEEGVEVRILVC